MSAIALFTRYYYLYALIDWFSLKNFNLFVDWVVHQHLMLYIHPRLWSISLIALWSITRILKAQKRRDKGRGQKALFADLIPAAMQPGLSGCWATCQQAWWVVVSSQRGQPEELVSLVGSGECSQIGQGQYIGAFMGFQLKLPKAVIMIGMVPKSSSPSFSKNKNTIRNWGNTVT